MRERALRGMETACADPGDLLALAAAARDLPAFYWEHPSGAIAIAAVGAVREVRAAGPERFVRAAEAAQTLVAAIEGRGEWSGGYVVGGFGFADEDARAREWQDFPALRLVLPEMLWIRRAGACRLVRMWEAGREDEHAARLTALTARAVEIATALHGSTDAAGASRSLGGAPRPLPVSPPDDRPRWSERVGAVRALIAAGTARKIVLARRREIRVEGVLDPARLLADARARRPSCIGFAVRHGAATFVGSTPELLARRNDMRVEASALAGSAARGTTPEADRRLGAALLECPKNAGEHALVVAAVRGALERIAASVSAAGRPELLRLPEAQHLHTAMSAVLARPLSVLEVAGLLHPTPAVCGVPLATARRFIETSEPERGWYTGAVGWMAGNGDGEFAVALRSALCERDHATIWAGAGIVDGSSADAEFTETEAKMTALFRGMAAGVAERAA